MNAAGHTANDGVPPDSKEAGKVADATKAAANAGKAGGRVSTTQATAAPAAAGTKAADGAAAAKDGGVQVDDVELGTAATAAAMQAEAEEGCWAKFKNMVRRSALLPHRAVPHRCIHIIHYNCKA